MTSFYSNHSSDLIENVNELLKNIQCDSQEVQTIIHPQLLFKYNSVNLLIGSRGSGKTYSVFKEIVKLCLTPALENFTQIVYVTTKTNDETYNKLKPFIQLPVRFVKYEDALTTIKDISECKQAYDEIIDKKLMSYITDECREDILGTLKLEDFSHKNKHTIVLFDDASCMFKKRDGLFRLLFENRQQKITYFICIHDPGLIDAAARENIDALWVFGGFKTNRFRYAYAAMGVVDDYQTVFQKYLKLSKFDVIYVTDDAYGKRFWQILSMDR